MKRVIFLDVDGVLNCQLLYEEQHRWDMFKPWRHLWRIKVLVKNLLGISTTVSLANYKPNPKHKIFKYRLQRFKSQTCQKRLGWLDELCKELDLKIVISSVWRRHFNLEEWSRALMELGFHNLKVIGITETRHSLRGHEIQDWLDKYGADDFVIIDDDSDMLPEQSKHFFQTDSYSGITPNTLYRIKRYLTQQ